jgi:hypothetical protein
MAGAFNSAQVVAVQEDLVTIAMAESNARPIQHFQGSTTYLIFV